MAADPATRPLWRVYYDDGSTFDSSDGSLAQAPALGVQAVVYQCSDEQHPTGRIVVHKFDFYWHEDGDWYGSDLFGLFDYLTRPGYKRVLFGRTMPRTGDYEKIINRACADPDFVRAPA